jgi:hypothetical protein
MAVARPELMVSEIDWLVALVDASGPVPRDYRRGVRELKRSQATAHAAADRERRQRRRVAASLPNAPRPCSECGVVPPRAHLHGCPYGGWESPSDDHVEEDSVS